MFAHDPTDTKPCPHMRTLVSAFADDALTGLARWYTRQHLASCPRCQQGLATIREMQARLTELDLDAETPEARRARWEKIEAALRDAESKTA